MNAGVVDELVAAVRSGDSIIAEPSAIAPSRIADSAFGVNTIIKAWVVDQLVQSVNSGESISANTSVNALGQIVDSTNGSNAILCAGAIKSLCEKMKMYYSNFSPPTPMPIFSANALDRISRSTPSRKGVDAIVSAGCGMVVVNLLGGIGV